MMTNRMSRRTDRKVTTVTRYSRIHDRVSFGTIEYERPKAKRTMQRRYFLKFLQTSSMRSGQLWFGCALESERLWRLHLSFVAFGTIGWRLFVLLIRLLGPILFLVDASGINRNRPRYDDPWKNDRIVSPPVMDLRV